MGAMNLGSIIPTLIGQNRAEIQAQQAQENQQVDQDVAMYHHLIQDPNVPPHLKGPAIERTMDLLEDHANLDDENHQKIGQILTGLAKSSVMQGAQGVSQRLQKIRDAAGFTTSPVPPGLQDPNMTIMTGQQAAPDEAVTVGDVPRPATRPFTPPTSTPPAQPDLSSLGLGPEADATPPVPDIPFAPGAQPSLRTLAGMQPSAPGEPPSRRVMIRDPRTGGLGGTQTVPPTVTDRQTLNQWRQGQPLPQKPPGPTPPTPTSTAAYPLLAQLANAHLTRMQKFVRAMAAMGAGLQGRQWTSPENLAKAQIQQQQMMHALQQQQIEQRWYVGQQYGLSGEELTRYALTGQLPASTTGTSRLTDFIIPPDATGPWASLAGQRIPFEWDPKTHTVIGPQGETLRLPPGTKFADPLRASGGVLAELDQAYADLADPNAPESRKKAAQAFIEKENPVPPDIKPGSQEHKIAEDLASGDMTFDQFKGLYAYQRNAGAMRTAIYNKAREINPNFIPSLFEQGYKFASNVKVRQQIASLDNVTTGVPDLIKFSDAAIRAKLPILNQLVVPGGVKLAGSKPYSNLQTARIAFADELSGALGYGSATDMSREMGFNMTDPNMSPEVFRSNVIDVLIPFVQRKRNSIIGMMGPYGDPRFMGPFFQGGQGTGQGDLPKPKTPGELISVEGAKKYLQKYGNDMESAMKAAQQDGWRVQ